MAIATAGIAAAIGVDVGVLSILAGLGALALVDGSAVAENGDREIVTPVATRVGAQAVTGRS